MWREALRVSPYGTAKGALRSDWRRRGMVAVPVVARGVTITGGPGGRIEVEGGPLLIGFDRWYPGDRTVVELRSGSVLAARGKVRISAGCAIWLREGARLEIGDGTVINPRSELVAADQIRIGPGCAIGWNVTIMDNDHHRILTDEGSEPGRKAVVIGEHVWIGTGAMILKGVTVGDGAVVAAKSVVTHDVSPGTVVAGQPARTVRKDVGWEL